ncbi:MAG TPA: MBL fold metallo-hydrolase [Trebonia sp.]|nr:MBL fold metallo-hydrolase [Trebonia sp.]
MDDPLGGVRWIHGSPPGGPADPLVQVLAVDDATFILRQGKDVNYEAPFLYLLCGEDRAVLFDTGAVAEGGGARETVDGLLSERGPDYGLVVAHTHGHGDHVAGDGQFAARPRTVVVPHDVAAVREFFGFASWPEEVVTFDLGGRALRVTGSPGHHDAAITVHDPRTGFLLTGDTVYPGRLYVSDMPAFVASLDRMAEFAAAHPVTHVLGCHIEMTRRRGRDYPLGCLYQPDEPPLQMTVARLGAVRDAAHAVADRPGAHGFGDFVIYNGPCERAMARQKVRGAISRARRRAMMILKPAHISVSQGLISWCGRDNDVRHRVERSVSVRWPGLRRVR